MSIKIGNLDITAIKLGGKNVSAVYLGSVKLWPEVSSIAITTQPTTTSYTVGDMLDLAGIVVTATYSNGSTADVTENCTFSPDDGTELDTEGTVTITVSYTEDGITVTTDMTVTVADGDSGELTLVSLEITRYPVLIAVSNDICSTCGGTGIDDETGDPCGTCGGSGTETTSTITLSDGTVYTNLPVTYMTNMLSPENIPYLFTVIATFDNGSAEDVTSQCEWEWSAADPYVIVTAFYGGLSDEVYVEFSGVTVCLSGDTLITMADGASKRLDALAVGELVLAADGSATTVMEIKSGRFAAYHTLYTFEDGTVVDETGRHRFYNADQGFWQHLSDWALGEHAVNAAGERIALVSVRTVNEEAEQFGLWTDSGDYYANGLLSGDASANARLLSEATAELMANMLNSVRKDTIADINGWDSFLPGREAE